MTEHRSAQCGRTFTHGQHEVTYGWCYGLSTQGPHPDSVKARDAAAQPPLPPAPVDPWGPVVPHEQLVAGLTVLTQRARGHCARFVGTGGYQPLGYCWERGDLYADATAPAERACTPCIAHRVLQGLPLPTEPLRAGTQAPEMSGTEGEVAAAPPAGPTVEPADGVVCPACCPHPPTATL